ncbi:pyridoxal phosphate-dependent aminotransferase [Luxibacter massiliensis]|uniref:pyridoxal phosphate-dependent aminotransferase n=1 Tax=Luxibacter massiliensis TaxID=2219695 RepID=UPI000F05F5BB|nr:threonine-phosphate decarboxylase [Luxibacter massiliensis]
MDYGHGGDIYTYQGMTDFSTNINPLGPSSEVLRTARESLAHIGEYPDSRCRELVEALSKKEGIPGETVVPGNGAADLIFSLVFAKKPKKAVLTIPSFLEYEQALEAAGCEIVYARLHEEENFCLTERYLDQLTEGVDLIFLCSPDNPSGQAIEKALLEKIVQKCVDLQITVVLDQCFYEFMEDQGQVMAAREAIKIPNIFLLRAFTKMYALPGLRVGYGISGNQELLKRLESARQPWSVSGVAQAAACAALEDQERVVRTRNFVSEERKMMEKELERIGVRYFPPSANYMLLKSKYDLFRLLKAKKILIRDCSNYRGLKKGYYRIAVKGRQENRQLIEALEEIYKEGRA